MRTLVLVIVATLLSGSLYAQDPVRIGIRAGGSFANQQYESDALVDFGFDPESRLGYEAGLVLDAPLGRTLTFQPALLVSQKGYRFEEDNVAGRIDIESRPLYIQMPLPFLVRSSPGPIRFLIGAGPYVAYGIGGNVESKSTIADLVEVFNEGDISWGDSSDDNYRPFDAGAVFMAGVEVSGLQLNITYEYGMVNILPQGNDDNYIHNRVLSGSVSFFLSNR
ncbi:MAG: porin family protein [Cyclobacteriaceae bacterium]